MVENNEVLNDILHRILDSTSLACSQLREVRNANQLFKDKLKVFVEADKQHPVVDADFQQVTDCKEQQEANATFQNILLDVGRAAKNLASVLWHFRWGEVQKLSEVLVKLCVWWSNQMREFGLQPRWHPLLLTAVAFDRSGIFLQYFDKVSNFCDAQAKVFNSTQFLTLKQNIDVSAQDSLHGLFANMQQAYQQLTNEQESLFSVLARSFDLSIRHIGVLDEQVLSAIRIQLLFTLSDILTELLQCWNAIPHIMHMHLRNPIQFSDQLRQIFSGDQLLKIFSGDRLPQIFSGHQLLKIFSSGRLQQIFSSEQLLQILSSDQLLQIFSSSRLQQIFSSEQLLKILSSDQLLQIFSSDQLLQIFSSDRLLTILSGDLLRKIFSNEQLHQNFSDEQLGQILLDDQPQQILQEQILSDELIRQILSGDCPPQNFTDDQLQQIFLRLTGMRISWDTKMIKENTTNRIVLDERKMTAADEAVHIVFHTPALSQLDEQKPVALENQLVALGESENTTLDNLEQFSLHKPINKPEDIVNKTEEMVLSKSDASVLKNSEDGVFKIPEIPPMKTKRNAFKAKQQHQQQHQLHNNEHLVFSTKLCQGPTPSPSNSDRKQLSPQIEKNNLTMNPGFSQTQHTGNSVTMNQPGQSSSPKTHHSARQQLEESSILDCPVLQRFDEVSPPHEWIELQERGEYAQQQIVLSPPCLEQSSSIDLRDSKTQKPESSSLQNHHVLDSQQDSGTHQL